MILTALVLSRAALSWWRWQSLTVVSLSLQRSHALLDGTHHISIEAVAVFTGVLSHNISSIGKVFSIHVATRLGRNLTGTGHISNICHLSYLFIIF